ncbi:endonuclease domain-containing protein [Caulobacter sp. KR2-114]|uniref:endonuclease domain-containing protein n=1 Tax=Caulobacter sp. KR2-114 TaxID=3400912 RepID=UPI003C09B547
MPKPKRALAKRMRRDPTAMEAKLWRLLRDRRLEDLKFRRQMPIGPYVADFACLRHRRIVEVDSEYFHDPQRDARRDDWFRSQDFRILRFDEGRVRSKPEDVLTTILEAAGRRPHSPLDPSSDPLRGPPSPAGEEGKEEGERPVGDA